jgi:hypothetical protein
MRKPAPIKPIVDLQMYIHTYIHTYIGTIKLVNARSLVILQKKKDIFSAKYNPVKNTFKAILLGHVFLKRIKQYFKSKKEPTDSF